MSGWPRLPASRRPDAVTCAPAGSGRCASRGPAPQRGGLRGQRGCAPRAWPRPPRVSSPAAPPPRVPALHARRSQLRVPPAPKGGRQAQRRFPFSGLRVHAAPGHGQLRGSPSPESTSSPVPLRSGHRSRLPRSSSRSTGSPSPRSRHRDPGLFGNCGKGAPPRNSRRKRGAGLRSEIAPPQGLGDAGRALGMPGPSNSGGREVETR